MNEFETKLNEVVEATKEEIRKLPAFIRIQFISKLTEMLQEEGKQAVVDVQKEVAEMWEHIGKILANDVTDDDDVECEECEEATYKE